MNPTGKENIAGYLVDSSGVTDCIAGITTWLHNARPGDKCRWLACINPHSYAESLKDPAFSTALKNADWLVPDGSGVVLASRMLGGSIHERVTGSDVFSGVCAALDKRGHGTVFFLGSTQETLAEIGSRMNREYPNLNIVGSYSPPFKPAFSERELDDMVRAVNAVSPDVLWVGMTAPKQEKWLDQQVARLDVRFAAAIGAVFDFYSGKVRRSHPVFQRNHLEWLPRLLQQPRRLWRRMAISAPVFAWHVFRQRLRIPKGGDPWSS